jgi:hypothetical protein
MLCWKDLTTRIRFEPVIGVLELNMRSSEDFLYQLKDYVVKFICKTDGQYAKYDIENGIFSRLQNNENLSKEKYRLISSLRQKMWITTEKLMSMDEVCKLFSV